MHSSLPRLVLLTAALGIAAPTGAQTVLVDANGRGDFTEIRTAVAKVSSGTVIRVNYYSPGYLPFTVSNKSVTIIGLPHPAQNTAPFVDVPRGGSSSVVVGPLAAGQRVVIRDLDFQVTATTPGSPVRIQGIQGAVALTNCAFRSAKGTEFDFRIDGSQNVHLSDCDLTTRSNAGPANYLMRVSTSSVELTRCILPGKDSVSTLVGSTGLEAVASSLALFETKVTGGRGMSSVNASTDGGPAIVLRQGSTLFAAGSTIAAIAGGNAGSDGNGKSSDGGDGILLTGASSARVEGFAPTGGLVGTGGTAGRPVNPDPSSRATMNAFSTPAIQGLSGTPRQNARITYTLTAAPSSAALFLVGFEPIHLDVGVAGPLLIRPLAVVPAVVPANPPLQLPVTVPGAIGYGTTVFTQFANRAGATVWASNAVVTTVR